MLESVDYEDLLKRSDVFSMPSLSISNTYDINKYLAVSLSVGMSSDILDLSILFDANYTIDTNDGMGNYLTSTIGIKTKQQSFPKPPKFSLFQPDIVPSYSYDELPPIKSDNKSNSRNNSGNGWRGFPDLNRKPNLTHISESLGNVLSVAVPMMLTVTLMGAMGGSMQKFGTTYNFK